MRRRRNYQGFRQIDYLLRGIIIIHIPHTFRIYQLFIFPEEVFLKYTLQIYLFVEIRQIL